MSRLTPLLLAALLMGAGACGEKKLDAAALNDRGLSHLTKGETDLAIADFDSALASQPGFASALKNRGVAYANKGDHAHALADFNEAIKVNPTMTSAFNSRGMLYQDQGRFDSALVDFDKAISLKADNGTAIKNRGRTKFFLGDFAGAASDLERGIAFDSTNAYVAIWLYIAKHHTGVDTKDAFAAQVAKTDSTTWPSPVAKYYLGAFDENALMAAAATSNSKTQSDQRCAASFYIGERLLWEKKTALARKRFEEAKACPKGWTEYMGAVMELGRS